MPSSINIIRALTQDKGTPPILEDADLQLIVDLEPNAFRAAAAASRAISGKFSELVDMGGGTSDQKLSQKAENYLALAKDFDKRAQQGGDGGTGITGNVANGTSIFTGGSISENNEVRSDPDRYDSAFRRGEMDNPSIGSSSEEIND